MGQRRHRTSGREPIARLRTAIDLLDEPTRRAMLGATSSADLLCGAYASDDGGACPMLAAHRRGARGDVRAFATAWDDFCGVEKPKHWRRATEREVRILRGQLEMSLLLEDRPDHAFGAAMAEHQALARTRRAREAADSGLYVPGEVPAPRPLPADRPAPTPRERLRDRRPARGRRARELAPA